MSMSEKSLEGKVNETRWFGAVKRRNGEYFHRVKLEMELPCRRQMGSQGEDCEVVKKDKQLTDNKEEEKLICHPRRPLNKLHQHAVQPKIARARKLTEDQSFNVQSQNTAGGPAECLITAHTSSVAP